MVVDVMEEVVTGTNSCNADIQDDLEKLEQQLDSIQLDEMIIIKTDSSKIKIHIEKE